MDRKKSAVKYIIYAVIAAAAIGGILEWRYTHGEKEEADTQLSETNPPEPSAISYLNDIQEPSGEYVLDDATVQSLRDELAQDKAINEDVKGILYFESGLIHKAVLQGTDNVYYISHQWEDGQEGATRNGVMLDAWNNLDKDEMNTIMYGHYWYSYYPYGAEYGLTPLSKLLDQANYEPNKYVVFVTEKEIRYYIVAKAFSCPLVHTDAGDFAVDGMQYNMQTYDSEYFKNYMEKIKPYEYYDTGVDLEYGDRFLTLQTCLEETEDAHEVVLCKELGRKNF